MKIQNLFSLYIEYKLFNGDATVTNYHQSVAYPVKNIVIDPVDWGYR